MLDVISVKNAPLSSNASKVGTGMQGAVADTWRNIGGASDQGILEGSGDMLPRVTRAS